MAAKNGAKTIFGKKLPYDSVDTLEIKIVKIALSCAAFEINVAFAFYTDN